MSSSNRVSVKLRLHLTKATSRSETIHDDDIDDVVIAIVQCKLLHLLPWDHLLTTVWTGLSGRSRIIHMGDKFSPKTTWKLNRGWVRELTPGEPPPPPPPRSANGTSVGCLYWVPSKDERQFSLSLSSLSISTPLKWCDRLDALKVPPTISVI